MTFVQHPYRLTRSSERNDEPDKAAVFDVEGLLEAVHDIDANIRETALVALGRFAPLCDPLPMGVRCSNCHQWKSQRQFSPDDRKRNGLDSRCKECEANRKARSRMPVIQLSRSSA